MPLWGDPQVPPVGAAVPRTHGPLAAAFGWLMMRLRGWRFEGAVPNEPRMILLVAPHTSNWDFLTGLWAKFALRLKAGFLGKHTLFWWPLGVFLRSIGGIAIDRSKAAGIADDSTRAFRESDRLMLVIAPEGTRSKSKKWKSGFYRIAVAAEVPILLIAFDYRRKVVRLGPLFRPTGDYEKDLPEIQSHFDAGMARRPENY
ncbi:MAG: lysophospholipid acyltransferase family protein [Acidobacteria bacterium]|jgi:1-acyl-sn-glycerol-3-phosphate acyltransferase|nr:lysophospholipid acyltransferase family protein [Acidobacteriota bacterium]